MTVTPGGRGPQLASVIALFTALSTAAILARCYCRVIVVKAFGVDDWFCFFAWLLFALHNGFALAGIYHGTGQHVTELPLYEIPVALKWWWICEPLYVLCNMALKFSIGWMLLRIAVDRTHKIIVWVVIIVSEVYGAFFFLLFVLQCQPSAYFWTRFTGAKGKCLNPKIVIDATYGYSAISCVADWTFGIIPIFMVWHLQMKIRTKLSVALILAMGAIASTATIIRIPYVKDLGNEADFLWATTDVAIWSISETGIGITACSLATLRPMFRDFFSKSRLFGTTTARAGTKDWPTNSGGGYLRTTDTQRGKEFELQGDVKSVDPAIITSRGNDPERGLRTKIRGGDWNESQKDLVGDGSSEDVTDGRMVIKKTASVTIVSR